MTRKLLVRATAAAILLITLGWAGLWLFAPQVFVLIREGFPAPIMPDAGSFALVEGRAPGPIVHPLKKLPRAARMRFGASGGRALLVDRGGTLQFAHFGPDIGPDTRLNSYSLVKSLIGALVLRAMAEGRLDGVEMPLRDVLGPQAPDVPLGALLDMTSGLSLSGEPPKDEKTAPVDDAEFSPFSPVARLHAFGVRSLLPHLAPDPDRRGAFHYQSVNTALLGAVLEEVYGLPLEQLLSEKIWRPAGAAPAYWRRTAATGRVSAYCCLYARAEDWRRVGRYLLDNGTEGGHWGRPREWHRKRH